jgi:hypothetical protein
MALILSLLFNDYGLPSGKAWIFFAIMICIIAVFSMVFDEDADGLPSYLISGFGLALYLVLFFAIASINQYEHIPISGTDIQKTNLKRCTVGKTITLENIEDIMTECQNRDQELKFRAKIESLDK